jgi:hypothetical protein
VERIHFSQLLNINGVNGVKEREIQLAEPLVLESSALETEMAVEKLKTHTSPGINQITAEMSKAGGRIVHSEIHKIIHSIRNKGIA